MTGGGDKKSEISLAHKCCFSPQSVYSTASAGSLLWAGKTWIQRGHEDQCKVEQMTANDHPGDPSHTQEGSSQRQSRQLADDQQPLYRGCGAIRLLWRVRPFTRSSKHLQSQTLSLTLPFHPPSFGHWSVVVPVPRMGCTGAIVWPNGVHTTSAKACLCSLVGRRSAKQNHTGGGASSACLPAGAACVEKRCL